MEQFVRRYWIRQKVKKKEWVDVMQIWRETFKQHGALIVLLVIGVLIRTWTIEYATNVDEGDYLMQGRELTLGHWPYQDVHLNKPPLVSFMAYPFFFISDFPIFAIRTMMIFLSASTLIAMYGLGMLLGHKEGGLVAAGLWALDPFAAVWAKYLHVSTLAPILSLWALTFFVMYLKRGFASFGVLAGMVTSLCLLNKQTGVTILPVLMCACFLIQSEISWRKLLKWFAIGFFPLPLALFILLAVLNAFEPFLYDTLFANFRMAVVFHYTLERRWGEFMAIQYLNPLAWYGVGLGVLAAIGLDRRLWLFVLWFGIEFGLNLFGLSHVWQHYILAIMPPAYFLAGVGLAYVLSLLLRWIKGGWLQYEGLYLLLILLLTIPFWTRANWKYPNMTIEDERGLAAMIERRCDSPYLLNFANTTFYILADKQVPPSVRGERVVRIPPFMNTAGRRYLSLDDMNKTVALWRTLPIDYCIMYAKYARQIFVEKDPLLEPVRQFLEEEFERDPDLSKNIPTYYAVLICYRKK